MSNGETLDNIEDILVGAEPMPQNVSNRLIFAAIKSVYQKSAQNSEALIKITAKVDCHESEIIRHDERIKNLSGRSNAIDVVVAAATAIGIALGIK